MASPKTPSLGSSSWFTTSRLSVLAVLIILFSLLYRPALQLSTFRSEDHTARLTRYADSSPLNSDRCTVNYAADACEDVNIHFASSTAFLTCGNPAERVHWYPPSSAHNAAARSEDSFREYLFKYDIKKKKTTSLRLEGLSGDFITHGIDVYSLPDDPTKV
jgi:arylesterase/paraoxonase